ncbi:alpha/beta hydrolase fold-domain-containing protein [Mucor mucedo]|uniref:alpha/beta hydrolase fold-domain-containing protein n=1 Tax=Mucor mucedo TaxID=29922 RepID=UPI00221FE9B2|nr:alpha/beta hydrolase fold-domain-containing protein [Mucor mucedo]KAI7893168.1 alpha/beta hydrolase fold-domain-containing protein [Mucor mucedo]
MVTKLIQPCASQGCCVVENGLDFLTADSANKLILSKKANPTAVIHELCDTVYQMPNSLVRLATDVWSHVKNEPKKPSWCIQTTVVMGFLQAFRDQSQTNSLEFWRLMLIAPSLIKPIMSRTEAEIIPIKTRNLCGILSKMDSEETGSRTLDAEWMSAISTWERICGSSLKTRLALDPPVSDEKIVMYIHGGAYCTMSAQTHRTLTHKISKATKRRVLAVNYRLAPETRFPGALFDVVQSFLYLIDGNDKHRFKPSNILVMGDSAGGGLCLAMMLYLRDHGLPQPEGAALLSPWVDLTFSYPSWKDASLYDYLPSNPAQLKSVNPALLYLDDQELIRHPYVSPIFADNFDNMPPILIQSGGCESLRDEICDLTDKIQKSKCTMVHHEIYEDMVHVFQAFPFKKSMDAIESIGWWSKVGIPLITQWQSRSQELSINDILD